jgi:hypothetical protein
MKPFYVPIFTQPTIGEMLKDQEMNKGHRFVGGRSVLPPAIPTLAEVGITHSMSSRAQKIASVQRGYVRYKKLARLRVKIYAFLMVWCSRFIVPGIKNGNWFNNSFIHTLG